MKLEKIKFVDIVNDKLTNNEIELLKGGILANGCLSNICGDKNIQSLTVFCTNGDGICAIGIASLCYTNIEV